jgi:hypothetical protein
LSPQIRGRQPYLIARKILYVIFVIMRMDVLLKWLLN